MASSHDLSLVRKPSLLVRHERGEPAAGKRVPKRKETKRNKNVKEKTE
jgi:hypothetical protein